MGVPLAGGHAARPGDTRKPLREVLAGSEWEGPHPHVFRHPVATRSEAAGLTAREITDHLGHERVSTARDVYMSRTSKGTNAGTAPASFRPSENVG